MEKLETVEKAKGVRSPAREKRLRGQCVNFVFYKVNPAWRHLPKRVREKGKKEFLAIVEAYSKRLLVASYSLLGFRADSDLMLWRVSDTLPSFQEMTAQLLATGLGKYLATSYSYLSMTRRSTYLDQHEHSDSESTRLRVKIGEAPYLFVYPFVKSREWYLLPKERRQEMMNTHFAVGHEFPSVRIHTTYSFGLDDQEFVLAFEASRPDDFLDLVMRLRETEASRYTVRDTPIFTCLRKPLSEILDSLG